MKRIWSLFAVLALLARIRDEEGVPFIPSLMSQFTPFYKAAEHNLGPPRAAQRTRSPPHRR